MSQVTKWIALRCKHQNRGKWKNPSKSCLQTGLGDPWYNALQWIETKREHSKNIEPCLYEDLFTCCLSKPQLHLLPQGSFWHLFRNFREPFFDFVHARNSMFCSFFFIDVDPSISQEQLSLRQNVCSSALPFQAEPRKPETCCFQV